MPSLLQKMHPGFTGEEIKSLDVKSQDLQGKALCRLSSDSGDEIRAGVTNET